MNVQSSKPQGSFFVRGTIALLALISITVELSEDQIIWNVIEVTDTILEDFIRLPSNNQYSYNTALTYEWRMNLEDLETLFLDFINKHNFNYINIYRVQLSRHLKGNRV